MLNAHMQLLHSLWILLTLKRSPATTAASPEAERLIGYGQCLSHGHTRKCPDHFSRDTIHFDLWACISLNKSNMVAGQYPVPLVNIPKMTQLALLKTY